MVGDGFCNDETNNPDCDYDGGDCCGSCINTDYCTNCTCIGNVTGNGITKDCCGHCEAIVITLENNALVAQGSMEGIYHNASMVNGKASWTSTIQAIWYSQGSWYISYLHDIGGDVSAISGDDGNQCPFNVPSEKWRYVAANGQWTSAGPNEISVQCLTGNFSKYSHFLFI